MKNDANIHIRLPKELKAEIEKIAEEDNRSLNNYMIDLIKRVISENK